MHSFLSIYSLPAAMSTIINLGNWATNQPVQGGSVVYFLVSDASVWSFANNWKFPSQLDCNTNET